MLRLLPILAALSVVLCPFPLQAESVGLLAESMLAATPNAHEVGKLSGVDGWWEEPPEFLDRLDPATGLITLVLQSYRRPEPGTRDRLMLAFSAYRSAETAAARFLDMEPDDNLNFGPVHTMPEHEDGQNRLHVSANPRGQSLRSQKGRFILRLTHWTDNPPMTSKEMIQLADLAFDRLRALERGKLKPPPPPALARLLPLSSPYLGSVMGTASGPSQWAAFDMAKGENVPDPQLYRFLEKWMRPEGIALRRWPLLNAAKGGQVVDALLIPFKSEGAAREFLALDRKNRSPERLIADPLPQIASHLEKETGERGGKKTLVMAKGRTVALLSCGAPYSYADKECDPALLALAGDILKSLTE